MSTLVLAQGQRGDYLAAPKPLGSGGYADVFPATHKPTGTDVALKRLRKTIDVDAPLRMEREIAAMCALAGHEHVMPILDADPNGRWYVMALAEANAFESRGLLRDDALAALLLQVASALNAAHVAGYLHRDVTPYNVLWVVEDGADGRWVLADWGLARRRPGMTTKVLTSTGAIVGTDGFIAPEVLRGEKVSESADVYSLGRLAAWAVTGRVPLAGEAILPAGPLRQLVRSATRDEPDERISLTEFQAQLGEVRFGPSPQPLEDAAGLLERSQASDQAAAEQLLALADENPADRELFLDFVAHLPRAAIDPLVATDPDAAGRLVEAMREHLKSFEGNFNDMNTPLRFMWECARSAADEAKFGLLEDAAMVLFEADASCVRYDQRRRSQDWLDTLRGQAATTVARALRSTPSVLQWYLEEDWSPSRQADPEIRAVLVAR